MCSYLDLKGEFSQSQNQFKSYRAAKKYFQARSTQIFFLSAFSYLKYFRFISYFLPSPDFKEHIAFVYLLSNCLNSGFSLLNSICLVFPQIQNLKLKLCMGLVLHKLLQGQKFSDAISEFPTIFPLFYVSVIRAGEHAGSLNMAVESLVQFYEKKNEFTKQFKQLMFYPSIIILFLILLIYFFVVFIAPQFKLFLGDLETFPLPSKILFSISDFLSLYFIDCLIYGSIFLCFFYVLYLQPKFKRYVHFCLLKIPLFGILLRDFLVFQFVKTLDVLFSNEVSFIDSIQLIKTSISNTYFQKLFENMHQQLKEGRSIRLPLMNYISDLPPLVFYTLITGEKSGSFSSLIVRLSVFVDRELSHRIKQFSSVFNPLVTFFLGFTVIFMMLAIYLPFLGMITKLLAV